MSVYKTLGRKVITELLFASFHRWITTKIGLKQYLHRTILNSENWHFVSTHFVESSPFGKSKSAVLMWEELEQFIDGPGVNYLLKEVSGKAKWKTLRAHETKIDLSLSLSMAPDEEDPVSFDLSLSLSLAPDEAFNFTFFCFSQ